MCRERYSHSFFHIILVAKQDDENLIEKTSFPPKSNFDRKWLPQAQKDGGKKESKHATAIYKAKTYTIAYWQCCIEKFY